MNSREMSWEQFRNACMFHVHHWNKALDINGNAVIKVFYKDDTTEILRGGYADCVQSLLNYNGYKKFYRSLSGLYKSK